MQRRLHFCCAMPYHMHTVRQTQTAHSEFPEAAGALLEGGTRTSPPAIRLTYRPATGKATQPLGSLSGRSQHCWSTNATVQTTTGQANPPIPPKLCQSGERKELCQSGGIGHMSTKQLLQHTTCINSNSNLQQTDHKAQTNGWQPISTTYTKPCSPRLASTTHASILHGQQIS